MAPSGTAAHKPCGAPLDPARAGSGCQTARPVNSPGEAAPLPPSEVRDPRGVPTHPAPLRSSRKYSFAASASTRALVSENSSYRSTVSSQAHGGNPVLRRARLFVFSAVPDQKRAHRVASPQGIHQVARLLRRAHEAPLKFGDPPPMSDGLVHDFRYGCLLEAHVGRTHFSEIARSGQ